MNNTTQQTINDNPAIQALIQDCSVTISDTVTCHLIEVGVDSDVDLVSLAN